MLGQPRRTTRTDVSLALATAGFVLLAWVLACWSAKQAAIAIESSGHETNGITSAFMTIFGTWGRHAFDILGPVWMFASLWMVTRAAHQRRIISWSWLLTSIQGLGAILIAAWASLAQTRVFFDTNEERVYMPDWFLAVLVIAILIWIIMLWLLATERIRLKRSSIQSVSAKTQSFR